jgi:hypothetical protein
MVSYVNSAGEPDVVEAANMVEESLEVSGPTGSPN